MINTDTNKTKKKKKDTPQVSFRIIIFWTNYMIIRLHEAKKEQFFFLKSEEIVSLVVTKCKENQSQLYPSSL